MALPGQSGVTAAIQDAIARQGGTLPPPHPDIFRVEPPVAADFKPPPVIPAPIFNKGDYGDMATIGVHIPSSQSVLALQRPQNTRILLIVQNNQAGPLYFAFDQLPDANSLFIPAGGTLFMDARVPQNNLYLFYGVAPVTIPVGFINTDIQK